MDTKIFMERDWAESIHFLGEVERAWVDNGGVFIMRGLPRNPRSLLKLALHFGNPMPKLNYRYHFSDDPIFKYAANVSYKPQISKSERMDTNDCEEITAHTARAYCSERPHYLALLMADEGWLNYEFGENGETSLVNWNDIFALYKSQYPLTYENDIHILCSEKAHYRPWYFTDGPVANEPIAWIRPDGQIGIRFWNHMPEFLKSAPVSADFKRIALKIDELANTEENRLTFQMRSGDSYIINNELIGHARKKFFGERITDGKIEFNCRQIYNFQLRTDAAPINVDI